MKIRRARNRFATLIELLIVIAILGVATGAIGIGIFKAVREQQFQSEVSQVMDTLRLAQDLMLVRNTDVSLKFKTSSDGNEILYWLEFDQQGSEKWLRESQREPKSLKWIQYVDFQNEIEPVRGSAEVRFFSGGAVMSQGDLRLSTSQQDDLKGALTRYILLLGYPSPIVSKLEETPVLDEQDEGVSEVTKAEVLDET